MLGQEKFSEVKFGGVKRISSLLIRTLNIPWWEVGCRVNGTFRSSTCFLYTSFVPPKLVLSLGRLKASWEGSRIRALLIQSKRVSGAECERVYKPYHCVPPLHGMTRSDTMCIFLSWELVHEDVGKVRSNLLGNVHLQHNRIRQNPWCSEL